MQFTGFQVVSAVVLLIGTILLAIAISTNYWSYYSFNHPHTDTISDPETAGMEKEQYPDKGRRGLWEACRTHKPVPSEDVEIVEKPLVEICENRIYRLVKETTTGEKDYEAAAKYMEWNYQVWELVCLAFICTSVLLGIIALLVSPCCCNRCGCCLAIFVFFAALASAVGISVYAYYQSNDKIINHNRNEVEIINVMFDWSFWCSVAGSACQLIASILFAISRGRSHDYSHQI